MIEYDKEWLTSDALYGCIKGVVAPSETYEVYKKEHIIQQELFGKYSRNNALYRKIFNFNNVRFLDMMKHMIRLSAQALL